MPECRDPRRADSPIVLAKNLEFGGLSCTLTNCWDHEVFEGRLFCLFISIKNRKFTRDYIKWFVNICDGGGHRGLICAVDEPYLYNRMAELAMDELPAHESEKIHQLSREVTRKAEKVIRGTKSQNVNLINWSKISAATPDWMKEEVAMGYQQQGAFWYEIRRHITVLKKPRDKVTLDRYARFFLCEIPVIIYSYYHLRDGVVDVYPGPNADVFRMIEQGFFEEELPRMTAFARVGCPLVYLDTGSQRQK